MKCFATITVIGRDKTGVIARVTNFLFEQKANIEALEEAVTRGQFSMVLQASWREGQLQPAELRKGLNALGRELGMEMRMRLSEPGRKQRMAIMVTREAACPEALLAAFKKGQLKQAEPVMVLATAPTSSLLPRNTSCLSCISRGMTANALRKRRSGYWKNMRWIS